MEFNCKRLEQRLESLKREKNLKSWTEHNNEFGTVITIRCSHKKMASLISATRESSKTSAENMSPLSTDESTSAANDTRANQTLVSKETSDCSAGSNTHSSTPPFPITNKTVFKPVSQYQMKRDQERLDAFRSRCTTRSRASEQSDKKPEQSMELQRSEDLNQSFLSNVCISPASVVPTESPTHSDIAVRRHCIPESPWAVENRYSCLDVDSVQESGSTTSEDELYGATAGIAPEPEPDPPTHSEIASHGATAGVEPDPDPDSETEIYARMIAFAFTEAMKDKYKPGHLDT